MHGKCGTYTKEKLWFSKQTIEDSCCTPEILERKNSLLSTLSCIPDCKVCTACAYCMHAQEGRWLSHAVGNKQWIHHLIYCSQP